MSTTAKKVEHERNLKLIDDHKKGKKKMLPRELIRVRMRCRLCGRARAVYRKFGICRICFRGMASNGLIPGLKKASYALGAFGAGAAMKIPVWLSTRNR